ncbi:hypothetical protein J2T12_001292 [Paenibacillus anaericanus]|uniref:DUF4177 domain-containing protein n=1 Tax=Paenibacillus anaericanus TaxID=170367 RepID=A0A433YEB4_9BACL|nr:DUF4177 domain-containing protein [Paenibacillus anaericanus]MDQ0087886.1 hypothetical protein [Paenibacillus anaericanus]RUT48214.1 DUF4177 domain-containing protein [Paenibacillus anaericanus]
MEQWEYKTIKFATGGFWGGKVDQNEFEDRLNLHGQEGWELISCFDTSQAQGASKDIIVVFKRKK